MAKVITVVIPTHNRITDLEKAVASILNQTQMPDELIVIDDGSYPPVKENIFNGFPVSITCTLIRNKLPQGPSHARNVGIKAAQGKFIAFLDDDDEFKKDKIKVLSEEIKDNVNADVFYHPAEIFMVKEDVTYFSKPKEFFAGEDIFHSMLISNKVGGTPMVIARKSALVDVGLFDEKLPALEDYELWLRLAKLQYKFKLIKTPLTKYFYVTKKESVSKGMAANEKAVALIEKAYYLDYRNLSKLEKKEYEEWKNKKIIHKSLLNGQVYKALKLQFLQFCSSPKPKHLLAAIVIIMGPKFVYKMKARFG